MGKQNGPNAISNNNKTFIKSRIPISEMPGGSITMHVVIQHPTMVKKNHNFINLYKALICFLYIHANIRLSYKCFDSCKN
ncbi:hypothetical protein MKW92_016155 [Papaver armeniacum]|nr:hypothetical protein MKW92_016155 [Papaver armeniacum]